MPTASSPTERMYDPQAYERMLRDCDYVVRSARLMAEMMPAIKVDEVALLFKNKEELDSFWNYAVNVAGLENFFSVPMDVMTRTDALSSFNVRFEFLRYPDTDWRIEAMCPLDGEYPLHSKYLRLLGNGAIVHVSFKLPTLEDYEDVMEDLRDNGFVQLASYQNTYGLFSYWETLETLYYWKPRVNLRDQLPQL